VSDRPQARRRTATECSAAKQAMQYASDQPAIPTQPASAAPLVTVHAASPVKGRVKTAKKRSTATATTTQIPAPTVKSENGNAMARVSPAAFSPRRWAARRNSSVHAVNTALIQSRRRCAPMKSGSTRSSGARRVASRSAWERSGSNGEARRLPAMWARPSIAAWAPSAQTVATATMRTRSGAWRTSHAPRRAAAR
jgi:hypothetical protein